MKGKVAIAGLALAKQVSAAVDSPVVLARYCKEIVFQKIHAWLCLFRIESEAF